MPRSTNTSCGTCGKPCYRSRARPGSDWKPPVTHTCQACRAANLVHGKPHTYKKRGCRCDECRQAWSAQCAKYQKRKPLIRTCDQCGITFSPGVNNQLRCSAACIKSWRAANKAARRGAIDVSTVDLAAIYERDDWTCGICELPVDPTAKYPDPGCASVDHVVPISRGGPHSESNIQLAHLYCNVVKGNRAEALC